MWAIWKLCSCLGLLTETSFIIWVILAIQVKNDHSIEYKTID